MLVIVYELGKTCSAQQVYQEHVNLLEGAACKNATEHYNHIGFIGGTGFADVTRVVPDYFRYSRQRSYPGNKGYPTIVHQATVDAPTTGMRKISTVSLKKLRVGVHLVRGRTVLLLMT